MQSKSPFKKVDIFDGRASSYRNPSTVIQPIVGAIVGQQIAKTAGELGTKAITTSMNKDQRAAEAAAGDLKHQRNLELAAAKSRGKFQKETTPDITTYGEFRTDQIMKEGIGNSKNQSVAPPNGVPDLVKKGREGKGTHGIKPPNNAVQPNTGVGGTEWELGRNNTFDGRVQDRPYLQNESSGYDDDTPIKHNASAVGSIAGAQPQSQSAMSIAGSALGGKSMAGIRAIGQKPTDSAQSGGGMFAAAAQAAGGLREFASQNKAYQESLPPPNQVAESGSYAGTGERMLEMDSNPVGNQSIGRDTDVASQLFGSGQRASMLAMKGTPLHNAGHGENKAHSHSSNKTTKFENNVKTLISDYSSEHDNVPEKPKKYINPFTASVNSKKQTQ